MASCGSGRAVDKPSDDTRKKNDADAKKTRASVMGFSHFIKDI